MLNSLTFNRLPTLKHFITTISQYLSTRLHKVKYKLISCRFNVNRRNHSELFPQFFWITEHDLCGSWCWKQQKLSLHPVVHTASVHDISNLKTLLTNYSFCKAILSQGRKSNSERPTAPVVCRRERKKRWVICCCVGRDWFSMPRFNDHIIIRAVIP